MWFLPTFYTSVVQNIKRYVLYWEFQGTVKVRLLNNQELDKNAI